MTKTYRVEVTREVTVEIDETKFTPEFMEEYREHFDNSFDDIKDHIEHLGWLFAAGRIDGSKKEFIEGYGPANEMGIKFTETGYDPVYAREIE